MNKKINSMKLTLAQQDILFDQLHNPENPKYNIGGYVDFGNIEVEKLKKAHELLIAYDDTFGIRINILNNDGIASQYIVVDRTNDIKLIDYSNKENPEEDAKSWLKEQFQIPFYLNNAELFKSFILRLSETSYWYVFIAHHIIIDGWGFANLVRKLGDYYHKPDNCLTKIYHWSDIVESEDEYIQSGTFNSSNTYWANQLVSFYEPILQPVFEATLSPIDKVRSGRELISLPIAKYNEINQLASQLNVGVSQVLLAALAVYFYNTSKQDEFIIGQPSHNRRGKAQRSMLGVFTGVNPLKLNFSEVVTFKQLVKQISVKQKSMYRHVRYPIGEIIRGLGSSGSGNNLFDVMFNYLKLDSELSINGRSAELFYLSHYHNDLPLTVTVFEYGQKQTIEFQFDFNYRYFSNDDAKQFASRYLLLLSKLVADIDPVLSTLSFNSLDKPLSPRIIELVGLPSTCVLESSLTELAQNRIQTNFNFLVLNADINTATFEKHLISIEVNELIIGDGEIEHQLQVIVEKHRKRYSIVEFGIAFSVIKTRKNTHVLIVNSSGQFGNFSDSLFLAELRTIYNKNVVSESAKLPMLDIQYADYSHWQSEELQGEVLAKELKYWKYYLADLPTLHNIPLDKTRPCIANYIAATHHQIINKTCLDELKEIATEFNVTLFTLLQTVFSLLLGRWSNENDIVVGTPMERRSKSTLQPLNSSFNQLILRTRLNESLTFTELLVSAKKAALDTYIHRNMPFDVLLNELKPQQSPSHNPLCQLLFSLEYFNSSDVLQKENLLESRNDLELSVRENAGGGLECVWKYQTALFESISIERLSQSFLVLLDGLKNKTQQNIYQLSLLSVEDETRIMQQSQPAELYPSEFCIHHLFEQQVQKTPKAIALVFEDLSISYAELNVKANQVAHHLIHQGVTSDRLVGLCLDRSLDMVIGLLAILKAGGAYVPLDPNYPSERLNYMLEDTQLQHLLTSTGLTTALNLADKIQITELNSKLVQEQLASYETTNPQLTERQNLKSLAYVIYTSGSTGQPKGVMVEHRSVVNFLSSMHEQLGFNHDDKLLAVTSINFDIHVLELYLPMICGAQVVLCQRRQSYDGVELRRLIEQHNITVMQATPATWQLLLESGSFPNELRVLCGGEVLSDSLAEKLNHKFSAVWNLYGPTETTVWSSCTKIEGSTTHLGKTINNTQFYILNNNGEVLPHGVVGELYIGGVGLARGYLNRPELTAERFIKNSFSDNPNDRLYKTGDFVRYLPCGNLVFIERVDEQVKIRGFRIELGEIETQLSRCKNIATCLVLALGDAPEQKRLVAYVISKESYPCDETVFLSELRENLKQNLPEYMVPSIFVVVDSFPLTPNGKIDRKGLPVPDMSLQQRTYIAPTTDTEKHLCEIWQEVLNLEQIGVTDNFFELGGHSLLATRIVASINTRLSLNSPLKLLFSNPRVDSLALALAELASGQQRPDITLVSREQHLRLSFAQQRLWLLDKIDGSSAHYNMAGALRLTGDLNIDALTKAINSIVERHESLRTYFIEGDDGQPLQVIRPVSAFDITITDISLLPHGEREFDLASFVNEEASKVFDLSNDLMMRAQLIKIEAQAHVLLVTMHHIASDGWSMGILINEFTTLYSAYVQGKCNPLPALEIQYADYAHWQRDWLQGEVLDAQVDYWQTQLAALPVVHSLSLDKARPKIQTFNGASHRSVIAPSTSDQLNALCKKIGGTLFMGLHATFSTLLSRYSNETDIVIGSPIANREQAEVAHLIGFFVNTLVLRCDLSNSPSFTDLLHQSKKTLLDAYAHQQVPFEQLVEVLQPARSMAHSPLFQVMLVLQNNEEVALELPDLTLNLVEQLGSIAKYDLTLNVSESDRGLHLDWEYNTDLFNEETIIRLAKHFDLLLTGLVNTPSQSVFVVNMLSAKETHQQLVEWNDTKVEYPKDRCIHELFQHQVNKNPDATAVFYEGSQITYSELNQRANQLAHFLIEERGVIPDTLVGICVERSLDMIVGIMAILKAGGAYVPLDPSYPAVRLAYMLEDANLTTVLTQTSLKGETPVRENQAIYLDSDEMLTQLIRYAQKDFVVTGLTSRHLAYVIYTSGSTGNPKGVLVEHDKLVNFIASIESKYHLNEQAKVLQFSTINFDIFIEESFGALSYGAQLFLRNEQCLESASEFYLFCQKHEISIVSLPTAFWHTLVHSNLSVFPKSLELVVVGGEEIQLKLVEKWFEDTAGSTVELINTYGPTETIVTATSFSMLSSPKNNKTIPIGRANENTQLFVLTDNTMVCPIGVPGELYIGGAGLARGYLNQEKLTREKFILNPFFDATNTNSSERLYKTGDLVSYLPDGNLEFLGRIDHQVKIRGFRIELGEIEQQLLSSNDVNDVVVVALSSDDGDKRLVAYVTNDDATLMLDESERSQALRTELIRLLREELSRVLPEYMVPSSFVVLEHLPLTPNGKIDRKGLPVPDFSLQQKEYVAPRTDTERLLCDIWQEVLGVEIVGITDNFFELGGHSLLATKVITQINNKAHVNLLLRELFETNTIQELNHRLIQASPVDPQKFIKPRHDQVKKVELKEMEL